MWAVSWVRRLPRKRATESAAILHIMARGHTPPEAAQQARELLGRIVSMLVRMTKG
jgi:hypothetical protein